MAKKTRDIRTVQPVRLQQSDADKLPVKGAELLPFPYGSLFVAGQTFSGKTNLLAHLLKHTIDERTTCIIFSSTIHNDGLWEHILKDLRRRAIKTITFDSLFQDGVNQMQSVIDQLSSPKEQPDKTQPPQNKEEQRWWLIHDGVQTEFTDRAVSAERKKVYHTRVPEHVIVIDDTDKQQLRHPVITNLLKKNRHLKARVIILSQHPLHLPPDGWSQLYMLLLGKSFSRTYIARVWDRLNLPINAEEFWGLYSAVTAEPFHFLNCDMRTNEVRMDFRKAPFDLEKVFE